MKLRSAGSLFFVVLFGLSGGVAFGQPRSGMSIPGMPSPSRQPSRTPVQDSHAGSPAPNGVRGGLPMPPGQKPGRTLPRRAPSRLDSAESQGPDVEECPNSQPEHLPPAVNYWRGMLMVNNALAQDGHFLSRLLFRYDNPGDRCNPKNDPPPLLASVLNFSLLAFVFYRFGRGRLSDALAKRKRHILADIETATKLLKDAERRLAEAKDRLHNVRAIQAQVRAEVAAQGATEKRVVLAAAEESRARMKADALARVEQEAQCGARFHVGPSDGRRCDCGRAPDYRQGLSQRLGPHGSRVPPGDPKGARPT